ncbi:MAG: hypothetical protein QXH81_08115 [Thermofilaceae archaeon]
MGKVKEKRREVTYRVWVREGGVYTPVHVRVAAIITLPVPIAKKWMREGVREVEIEEREDGSLLLLPVKGGEAVQPLLSEILKEKEGVKG